MMDNIEKENVLQEYPIIYSNTQRSRLVVLLELALTVIGTLVVWAVFFYFVKANLFSEAYLAKTMDIFAFCLLVMVIEFLVLWLWAMYNKLMYGGKDRRKSAPMVDDEAFAFTYALSLENLRKIREAKQVNLVGKKEGLFWKFGDVESFLSGDEHLRLRFRENSYTKSGADESSAVGKGLK